MTKTLILPAILPVFPLSGAVLFPRGRLPLHIFEPRYIALVEEVLHSPLRLMGMIQPISGPPGTVNQLARIGCAGRISSFSELEDGRYMITLTGISRFRIGAEAEAGTRPFRSFAVDWKDFTADQKSQTTDLNFDADAFIGLVRRFLMHKQFNMDVLELRDADPESLINALSIILPFDSNDKQALLEAPSLETRHQTLTSLMEFSLLTTRDIGLEGKLQ